MNAFLPRAASALLFLGLVAGCNDRMGSGSGSGRAALPTSGTNTPIQMNAIKRVLEAEAAALPAAGTGTRAEESS